jgi:hypothetical protein
VALGTTEKGSSKPADNKGSGKGKEQVVYVFKGTIAQDGKERSLLLVNVEKGNKAVQHLVNKQLEFAIS